MSELVLSEDRGPVRHVVLNRPEKRNAFHGELVLAIGAALRAAADDPDVRCVVLRGAGPLFSSGMDLGVARRAGGGAGAPAHVPARTASRRGASPRRCPSRSSARSRAACIGGALELALACDLRVIAADAIVGMPETRIGLIPDVGGSSRLPQVVGLGRAKELVMTGRLIGAEEAERIGLVNRVAPPEELDAAVQALVGRAARLRAARRRARQARDGRLGRARRSRRRSSSRSWRRSAARRRPTSRRARGVPREARRRSSAAGERPRRRPRGGTGGAKLARGMLDVAGEDLVVIANTGDDVEIHGGHVSPDPDLVTFWLADRIDERGWGLRDDTFAVMDALRALGEDVWFNLGDQDLAVCLQRARRLAEGATLTEATDELRRALGVPARVLPMADAPVRTWVRARGAWRPFQAFMIRDARGRAGRGRGVPRRRGGVAGPEVAAAIAGARAVIVGPSNPVISIGPILARARHARGAAGDAGAGRRGLAARRRTGAEGTDRRVHGLDRRPAVERRHRRALRRAARRARGRRAHRRACRCSRPTWPCPTPPGGGAWRRRRSGSRRRSGGLVSLPGHAHGRRPPRQVVRPRQAAAWATAVGQPDRAELAAGMVGDVLAALARCRSSTT